MSDNRDENFKKQALLLNGKDLIKYTITNETVTVLIDGETRGARAGEPNYIALRDAALRLNVVAIREALKSAGYVAAWSRGRFVIEGNSVRLDGAEVPPKFGARLRAMAARGEDVDFLLRFFERLSKNPSRRSVEQLFDFLEHGHIPILPDGCFLAYKGVTAEHRDVYTGTFDNRPGSVRTMPRHLVNDDADVACHAGFHVGALEYAKWFLEVKGLTDTGHIIVCRVAPEDVVCVPKDSSMRKVRVWRYEVVGEWSGEPLSSTSHCEPLPLVDAPADAPTDAEMAFMDAHLDKMPSRQLQAEREMESAEDQHRLARIEVQERDRRRHAEMIAMTPAQLVRLPVEELRGFIARGLRVVGAVPVCSKSALVGQIARLRSKP